MSKSQLLRASERRRIQALLSECLDLGADPVAWREHLLTGLCRLAGAALGMAGDSRLVGPQRTFELGGPPILVGWADDQRRHHYEKTRADGLANDEVLRRFTQPGGRVVTRDIEEVIARPKWYVSTQFQELMRPVRVDGNLVSFIRLDAAGRIALLSLFRPLGDRWFSRRQVNLVQHCQEELAGWIGRILPTMAAPGLSVLSPRLRQTLDCLLEGDSEKQAAIRLGISAASVHDYVKALHRHFGAASRGELLAVFLHRRGVAAGLNHAAEPQRIPAEMAPRLRATLQCLVEGASEKQAARQLGISRETVHKNVQALYRHFAVHSRAELLAFLLSRHVPGSVRP
jgi:DNA-binding NarL/FixJ family response regulator